MPKFEFCIPTVGKAVPAGAEWFHEIKYDGYRLRVERDGDRVRLITRGGYEWSKRFPWIVEAALKNRRKQFVIDGEAVVLGVDGVSDFDGLRSGKHDAEVQLYAFDCLALDGDNLRKLPLSLRKTNLAQLLERRPGGIFLAPFEQGEIGPDLFRKACEFGFEGLVSKHRDRSYRAGTSPNWIKVKTLNTRPWLGSRRRLRAESRDREVALPARHRRVLSLDPARAAECRSQPRRRPHANSPHDRAD
jgi:bifunctional non-homologous end joining protein LigD